MKYPTPGASSCAQGKQVCAAELFVSTGTSALVRAENNQLRPNFCVRNQLCTMSHIATSTPLLGTTNSHFPGIAEIEVFQTEKSVGSRQIRQLRGWHPHH